MKPKQKFLILILTVLILNIIWESLHYQLYFDLSGIPHIMHLITASLSDMLIITGIFLIISLKNKSMKWINKPKKLDYTLIIILGLIIAAILEVITLDLGRWAYKEIMPIVFGIGLSPLMQLAITAIIALKLNEIFN